MLWRVGSVATKLVEFDVGDGKFGLMEVDEIKSENVKQVSASPGKVAARARKTFSEALKTLEPTVEIIHQRLNGMTTPADEVEVKFSVKLSAEMDAVVTKVGGEANYEITLKWKNDRSE